MSQSKQRSNEKESRPLQTDGSKLDTLEDSPNNNTSDPQSVQELDLGEQYYQALRELADAREARPRDSVRVQRAKKIYNRVKVVYYRSLKEEVRRRAKANGVSIKEQRRLDLIEAVRAARARLEEVRAMRAKQ